MKKPRKPGAAGASVEADQAAGLRAGFFEGFFAVLVRLDFDAAFVVFPVFLPDLLLFVGIACLHVCVLRRQMW